MKVTLEQGTWLDIGGRTHEPGSTVEVSGEVGKALIASGSARPVKGRGTVIETEQASETISTEV